MSNLKLDIIYYKTPTDFEMEFNLNGCCRMRIFKDKVETPKELVKALARDVSRSKIIIVVTDLAGYDNGVEIVSKSVGLPLCSLNKSDFGIQAGEDVLLPKNAVPLINKSGIYGGCILESGPQSIILISSVRSLRHEILKAYVHNYIFDIGQIDAYNKRMGNDINATPMSNLETNNTSTAEETSNDENIEIKEEETINMVVDNNETSTEPQDVTSDFTENEIYSDNYENELSEESYPSDVNTTFIISEEPFASGITPDTNLVEDIASDSEISKKFNSVKHNNKRLNIVLLILAVMLLICIGVLTYFFVYLPLIGAEPTFFAEDNFITSFIKEYFMN